MKKIIAGLAISYVALKVTEWHLWLKYAKSEPNSSKEKEYYSKSLNTRKLVGGVLNKTIVSLTQFEDKLGFKMAWDKENS